MCGDNPYNRGVRGWGIIVQLQIQMVAGAPIHAQIVAQIRLLVAAGQVVPGQQLPTVRDLAQTLHLNPSTVAKAYAALERAGVIITRRGAGSFVADRPNERLMIDPREDRLNTLLAGAALEALSA